MSVLGSTGALTLIVMVVLRLGVKQGIPALYQLVEGAFNRRAGPQVCLLQLSYGLLEAGELRAPARSVCPGLGCAESGIGLF